MANRQVLVAPSNRGSPSALSSSDILVDASGNVIVPPTPRIVSTTTGISFTATGTTNLYTVPAGKTFVPTGAIIRPTVATSVTVDAVAGIGVAAGEDDIFSPVTLTNMRSTSSSFCLSNANGLSARVSAASVVKLGIDTAATATTLTCSVDLLGYFQDETTAQGGGFSSSFIGCIVRPGSSQSISNSSEINITSWTVEEIDTNGFHSNVTNPDRITIPTGLSGKYMVCCQVQFLANATGYRALQLYHKNSGGTTIGYSNHSVAPVNGALTSTHFAPKIITMDVGDYVYVTAYQTSGGSLGLGGASTYPWDLYFYIMKLSD